MFADRYEKNDAEGTVTAIWNLGDGKVDTWIVQGLIPGDLNENGEIESKQPSIPRSTKIKKGRKRKKTKKISQASM